MLLRFFVFFMVEVPTGSMLPTINLNDRLLVTKIYNMETSIKRGDIIVFDSKELNKLLIKRCIGLPNDTVEVKTDGSVYINGEKRDEPYVVNNQIGAQKNFKVPAGHYLFFGDNRSNSHDARFWKEPYIPASAIQAKARWVMWPFNRFGALK
ncbi:MAG: signal peptidase I [Hyphomonadaceae bacterium]|nr:signal peptidase I [Clostridia bacterium]